jgi:hypothetical protein
LRLADAHRVGAAGAVGEIDDVGVVGVVVVLSLEIFLARK